MDANLKHLLCFHCKLMTASIIHCRKILLYFDFCFVLFSLDEVYYIYLAEIS